MYKLDRVELRLLQIPLRSPFETSFMRETVKDCILVAVQSEGLTGWGEVVAMSSPFYNEETLETAWHILKDFLVPLALSRTWLDPEEWSSAVLPYRRNYMAKASIEAAFWDLHGQALKTTLSRLWGGSREQVEVGISLGIESSYDGLQPQIEDALARGYRRIKLKIKPGWDLEPVRKTRLLWPDIALQVDANSAYTLQSAEHLKALDAHDLLLIEQPLEHDDIVDHASLQKQLQTPICLDESIDTVEQCRRALQLGSARIINIKPGRVGGFTAARKIHDLCLRRNIPVWCGGMLETGIGRMQNLALASLPGFTLPGDLSASERYFAKDIIEPPVELDADGTVRVPQTHKLPIDHQALQRFTLRTETFP